MRAFLITMVAMLAVAANLHLAEAGVRDEINAALSSGPCDMYNFHHCKNFQRLCYLMDAVRAYQEQKMSYGSATSSLLKGINDRITAIGGRKRNCYETDTREFSF